MSEILTQNVLMSWLVFGAICIFLEAAAIPGVGFLFAGLAAITTGGLVQFGMIGEAQYSVQLSVFLGASFVWAAALWVPMQRFHKKTKATGYSNMVGDTAIVVGVLAKGNDGEVKWSGAIMQAVLAEDSAVEKLEEGAHVKIISVDGNVLKVEPK